MKSWNVVRENIPPSAIVNTAEESYSPASRHDDPVEYFCSKATETSSVALAIQKSYNALKSSELTVVQLGDIHVRVQLPPFLDSLLHDPKDLEYPSDDEDEDGVQWGDESVGWRLPALTKWKSLLAFSDEIGAEADIIQELSRIGLFEGDIKEEDMLAFLDHTRPDLTYVFVSLS